jgi:hypothetical protein
MSLSSVYQELHRRARETGLDRAFDLSGGARIAVRSIGGVTTLTISRGKGKKLSSTEIEVFKRDCGVPASAVRFPPEGQNTRTVDGVVHFYIAYRWRESEST